MDIQRKSPTRNVGTAQVTPLFREKQTTESRLGISEKKEYILGEEQLWYEAPEPIPLRSESFPSARHPSASSQPRVSQGVIFWDRLRKISVVSYGRRCILFLVVLLILGGGYGVFIKSALEKNVISGMQSAELGMDKLGAKDFPGARSEFQKAEHSFQKARQQTLYFPSWLARPLTLVPGVSKIGSGILAVDASTHLVRAGLQVTTITETVMTSRERIEDGKAVSYLAVLEEVQEPLVDIREELQKADRSLGVIPERDIPEQKRAMFGMLQKGVPGMIGGIDSLLANTPMIEELLGKNGPRIYLFLFQNNQELRPTGGFIGTYGILEFKNGHARRFFIDGIFNPDGQLKENIVPPKPIQKISASWSMHDSNWFPDFPTSAEKAIFFYEKTGGPTVDGVFTLTPTVMERLLTLTGPIELPEYEMVVESKNFIPTIQEQVEVKYDKEENKPKKVLADLSSILMERVFSMTDPVALYQIADIFVQGMNERQILLYTRNPETQAMIEASGWSGKIETAPHDYVSVINTNVNGYKTDGVINDSVEHSVQIEDDGSVIATTAVTRVHTGGNTPYEWWNKVNSNYMRVYVPKGSKLLNATGHTREFPVAPLDYQLLGFKEDPTVLAEENKIQVDENTGTRVGEEFEKTVFGNWVYVSPGETVRVEYTYLLPFRVDPEMKNQQGYSLLFQKQPGVDHIDFQSTIQYPSAWDISWQSEDDLLPVGESGIQVKRSLRNDIFWGLIFEK